MCVYVCGIFNLYFFHVMPIFTIPLNDLLFCRVIASIILHSNVTKLTMGRFIKFHTIMTVGMATHTHMQARRQHAHILSPTHTHINT